MSDRRAQPIYFMNFQEGLRRLWKDDVGTESTVNR